MLPLDLKKNIIKALDAEGHDILIRKDAEGTFLIKIGDDTLYDSTIWDTSCILDSGIKTTVGIAKRKGKIPYAVEIDGLKGYKTVN